jgi:hypothetical protein
MRWLGIVAVGLVLAGLIAVVGCGGGEEEPTSVGTPAASPVATKEARATATAEPSPPTSTPAPVPTDTPKPPLSSPTPAWSCVSAPTTYHNDQFGFEFQYCRECPLAEQSEGAHGLGGGGVHLSVTVGSRLELHVSDSSGLTLADLVSQVASQLEAGGASIDTVTPAAPVDGVNAVTLQYRFGGPNRFGEATFFQRNGLVYDVGFTAGAFTCNEPQAYEMVLSTFRFTE